LAKISALSYVVRAQCISTVLCVQENEFQREGQELISVNIGLAGFFSLQNNACGACSKFNGKGCNVPSVQSVTENGWPDPLNTWY
jgi:hypothetical protein